MADSIRAPDPFDFEMPQSWPSWIKRFERYLHVKSETYSDPRKISSLIYFLGARAEDVFNTFTTN